MNVEDVDPTCKLSVLIFYIEYKYCSKQNYDGIKWGYKVP